MKKLFLFILFSFLMLQNSYAKYSAPIKIKMELTSSFGEFRSGHFHDGIDISTKKVNGYRVYAVSDGYVWRIKRQYRGYGLAVYIKHTDGNISVYAHLDDIVPKLKKHILSKTRYFDEFFSKNQIRIRKGEFIAYTGESGAGLSHLHFAVRNKFNEPINPVDFFEGIDDYKKPEILKIIADPLDINTKINNKYGSVELNTKKINNGIYNIDTPLFFNGAVGLKVCLFDRFNSNHSRLMVKRIILKVNKKIISDIKFDKFSYKNSENSHIYSLYDNNLSTLTHTSYGYVAKMYVYAEKEKNINFYKKLKNLGHLDKSILKHGKNEIEIIVYDFKDNQSYCGFSAYLIDKNMGFTSIKNTKYNVVVPVFLKCDNLKISGLKFELLDKDENVKKLYSFTGKIKNDLIGDIFDEKYFNTGSNIVRAKIEVEGNKYPDYIYSDYFYIDKQEMELKDFDFDIEFIDGGVLIKVNADGYGLKNPEYKIISDNFQKKGICRLERNNLFTGLIDSGLKINGWVKIKIIFTVNNKKIEKEKYFLLNKITDEANIILSEDAILTVYMPENSFVRPTFARIGELNKEKFNFDKRLELISKIYKFYPQWLYFFDKAYLKFYCKNLNEKKDGIYFYNYINKKWKFYSDKINKEMGYFTAGIKRDFTAAVFRDLIPPKISNVFSEYSRRRKAFYFYIMCSDIGKGVDNEEVDVWLDGKLLDNVEYDPDRNWIKCIVKIKEGVYNYKVVVKDLADNLKVKEGRIKFQQFGDGP